MSSDLVAVSFPTASTGWAVSPTASCLESTNGGGRWIRQFDGNAPAGLVDFDARGELVDAERAASSEEGERFAAQGAEHPFLDVRFEERNDDFRRGRIGTDVADTEGGELGTWLHAVDNPESDFTFTRFAGWQATSTSSANKARR